jgi:excisionase family DNA binding protein
VHICAAHKQLSESDQMPTKTPAENLDRPDRVITVHEAALLAGVSPDTLRRLNKRNELRIIKLSPRRVGVRLSDLRAFLDARAA